MIRKIVLLLLIAAAAADQITPKSGDDETKPEKRSLSLALKAYNAVGKKMTNLGHLVTYGHLPPVYPPFADPVQAPLADPEQAPLADPVQAPLADPVQAPLADPVPVAQPVPDQPVFAPQPAPVSRVYIPVEKKVPVFVKVPYAVPKLYPVTVEKHFPVPYNQLVPYPVTKLVPYPVPQDAPTNRYISQPYVSVPHHRVGLKKKCKKLLKF